MRDGHTQIQLTESSIKEGVTFYHFHITHQGRHYRVNYRYSKLRTLAMTLPEVMLFILRQQLASRPPSTSKRSSVNWWVV